MLCVVCSQLQYRVLYSFIILVTAASDLSMRRPTIKFCSIVFSVTSTFPVINKRTRWTRFTDAWRFVVCLPRQINHRQRHEIKCGYAECEALPSPPRPSASLSSPPLPFSSPPFLSSSLPSPFLPLSSPPLKRNRIWSISALKSDIWWQQFHWFSCELTNQILCSLHSKRQSLPKFSTTWMS